MAKRKETPNGLRDWFVHGICDKDEFAFVVRAATSDGAFKRVAELTGRHVIRHNGKAYLSPYPDADIRDELDGNMGSPRRSAQATATPFANDVNLLG